jgi:hypothetical protein
VLPINGAGEKVSNSLEWLTGCVAYGTAYAPQTSASSSAPFRYPSSSVTQPTSASASHPSNVPQDPIEMVIQKVEKDGESVNFGQLPKAKLWGAWSKKMLHPSKCSQT